jgi:ubiquinone/menaquinone biosynthesis C-methylase UbiE
VTTTPDATPSPDATPPPEETLTPDNPFAASAVGLLYQRGRPYHHPRSLARLRSLVGADPKIGTALDVACGTGMSTIALAEIATTVVGLDVSPEMMRVAPVAPNVTYMLGRAEQLPFASDAFAAVTCSSGVHWFDQTRFFAELARVVRPGGWVGLYDHYFMGMQEVDAFVPWVQELFARYPLPPRNLQAGDPRSEAPPGFETVGTEVFDDPIEMTREEFADYQLTVSNCVAAVERGTPRAEIREWLLESTEPLFEGSSRRVQFVGTANGIRRVG